jgi:UDP-N-acetylmuramate dehydrogenase
LTAKTAAEQVAGRLDGVPGVRVQRDEPLARYTTLKIGGRADLLIDAGSESAVLATLRAASEAGLPLELLGLGSNLLVPDEGLRGVVLRLTGELRRIRIHGRRLSAGAGVPLPQAARRAAKAGLAGLEALSGFPSTVGGGVFMNAGCYGTEIKDTLVSVRVVERSGARRRLSTRELEPSYRSTNLKESRAVVTRALFELVPGDSAALLARIEELNAKRWAALPSGLPNAGSIFKNPPGDYAGRLIEACGLKGREAGGAQISEKHANVIVNRGGATAADVLALMNAARDAVAERFGVTLENEVIPIGSLAAAWRATTRATNLPSRPL